MSKNLSTFDIRMEFQILSKAKAKEIKSLSSKKERDKNRLFFVEGSKGVKDILGSFDLEYLIATDKWLRNNRCIIENYQDKVMVSDHRGLEIISLLKSVPDVIAVFNKPELEQDFSIIDKNKIYLLLDEIQDPGNLGTIIRTCDWFGVYDIFASENTVDVYNPKVIQATMGSLARVKVIYVDLKKLINNNQDIPLIGTLLEGKSLNSFNFRGGGFLIMGNEGRGISEDLKQHIDFPVTIPPAHTKNHPDSLNVAIATGIMLSHLLK